MNPVRPLILAALATALAACGSSAPAPHSAATTTPAAARATATPTASGDSGCTQAVPVFARVNKALAGTRNSTTTAQASAAITYAEAQLTPLRASLQMSDPHLAGQVAAFTADLHVMNADLNGGTAGEQKASGADSISLTSAGNAIVATCPGLRHDILGN